MKLIDIFGTATKLTRARTIEMLRELIFFHRTCAHIISGLIPRVVALEAKLELASQVAGDMDQAIRFRERLNVFRTFDDPESDPVPGGFLRILSYLEEIEEPVALKEALTGVIRPGMTTLCDQFLDNADPWLDARSVNQVQKSLGFLRTIPEAGTEPDQELTALWQTRHEGESRELVEGTWRVTGCESISRPEGFSFATVGSMRPLFKDLFFDKTDIGKYLHGLMDHGILTLEASARYAHEAPDMPWEFHLEMARQVSDRARQTRMLQRLLPVYGVVYGDYLCDRSAYERFYRFDPCEPGSDKELLWRLLLKIVHFQANELGPFHTEAWRRGLLGDKPLSHLFATFTCDAVSHVRGGLKWARHLCGGEPMRAFEELKKAKAYLDQTGKDRRSAFEKEYPERVREEARMMAEVEAVMREKTPDERALYLRRFSRKLRSKAGFLEEEIDWAAAQQGIPPEKGEKNNEHP